jgi:hypothetical protein
MIFIVGPFGLFRRSPSFVCTSRGRWRCGHDSCSFHEFCIHIMNRKLLLRYCKLPVVVGTGLPMASPDTRSSTRRFCCLPAELSLVATGIVLP